MKTIDEMIEYLKAFQNHKAMYVCPVSVSTVRSFLMGFGPGSSACGIKVSGEIWWAAGETRGWERSSVGPTGPMRAAGLSDEQIIDELIEIEIEALRMLQSRDR